MNEVVGVIPYTSLGFILNEPLSKHTTFGVGGSAKYFVRVSDINELIQIIKFCVKEKIRYFGSEGKAKISGPTECVVDKI